MQYNVCEYDWDIYIYIYVEQHKYNGEAKAWYNFSFQTSLLILCGLKPVMKADSHAKEGLPTTYRTEVQKAKSLQACKNTLIKGAVHGHSHSARTTWVFPWLMISLEECKPHYIQGLAVYQAKYIGNWASWGCWATQPSFVRHSFPLLFHEQRVCVCEP